MGTAAERIRRRIETEIAAVDLADVVAARGLTAFRNALVEPREVSVQFSGGITQTCWTVTESDGDYRVIFIPVAGVFALCVESAFGPLDIGVHGDAIGCFASV
ncbi:MAG: hypothetical protein AAGA05_02590 [Pseudomonadota bacterium]